MSSAASHRGADGCLQLYIHANSLEKEIAHFCFTNKRSCLNTGFFSDTADKDNYVVESLVIHLTATEEQIPSETPAAVSGGRQEAPGRECR